MTKNNQSIVRSRQDPLFKQYKESPDGARITDHAKTTGGPNTDPFHGQVIAGDEKHGMTWSFGIHHAVGGFHDAPNPGDMLCAALASCLDSTIRIIAGRMGIVVEFLEVEASADIDVRGTLLVDKSVPVGFQSMRCHVNIRAEEDANPQVIKKLIAAAEHSCVVLQTLRSDIVIETTVANAPQN